MSGPRSSPGDRSGERGGERPIPDGGLGEAMPDWLRRPPAWRSLEPGPSPARRLPPPDTSVIDPDRLLTVEDLPDWLQTLANIKSPAPTTPPALPPAVERRVIPRVIEATGRQSTVAPAAAPSTEPALMVADVASSSAAPPVPPATAAPGRIAPANATTVLGTLLVVALAVIVILLWRLFM